MSTVEKKGITTKVDTELHAKARQYMSEHNDMKMEEFITNAIESYLQAKPKEEEKKPEKMRTLAFQVPESFYQEVKDYLERHGDMKQNRFMLGLIRQELDREKLEMETLIKEQAEQEKEEPDEEQSESENDEGFDEEETDAEEQYEDNEESEDEEESQGMTMCGM